MSATPHRFPSIRASALMAGLAAVAWAAPLVSQAANPPAPAQPPQEKPPFTWTTKDVAVVERPLRTSLEPYAVMESTQPPALFSDGRMLLIFMPFLDGRNEHPAQDLAPWSNLVDARPDVVVAVPGDSNMDPIGLITEIIDDTVARDHVNPRHVFIVGYCEGVVDVQRIVGERPDLFAGMAWFSSELPPIVQFYSPALKKAAGQMPLYAAQGTLIASNDRVDKETNLLENFGFTQMATDRPNCGLELPQPIFDQSAKNMMALFDRALAENHPKELALEHTQHLLAQSLIGETRTLANPKGVYLLLTHDPKKSPMAPKPTLLICLYNDGDTAENFAKYWTDLVQNRADVVVAIPKAADGRPGSSWGPATSDLVTAIINDTVARDHINPGRVILVGAGTGADAAGVIAGKFPEKFAGFAAIGPSFPDAFFTPAVKARSSSLAVYYADATKDHAIAISPATYHRLVNFGFMPPNRLDYTTTTTTTTTNLQIEVFHATGNAAPGAFKFSVTRLMRFFDETFAGKTKDAAPAIAGQQGGGTPAASWN